MSAWRHKADWCFLLNRSALVVKPTQPFLDWLHAADPTSHNITLSDVTREPTIYLIPECDSDEDVIDALCELYDEIFTEKLEGWYQDEAVWPQGRTFKMFCQWFDFQHHSMLVDLDNGPLVSADY